MDFNQQVAFNQPQQNAYTALAIFGGVFYVLRMVLKQFRFDGHMSRLGRFLTSLPKPLFMILMALPEQYVLMTLEPQLQPLQRYLVSVAMYVIHFAFNGAHMKPFRSYNELTWILGTAYYAYSVIGVSQNTAVALVAADAVMTLALRGMA